MSYLEGANQIMSGLERQMKDLETGWRGQLDVKAKEAFGELSEEGILKYPISALQGQKFKVGDAVVINDNVQGKVCRLTEDSISIDTNHELAGVDLTFDIEIVGTRKATQLEISHGHSHDQRDPEHNHNHDHSHDHIHGPGGNH